jgi:hypothetical protein
MLGRGQIEPLQADARPLDACHTLYPPVALAGKDDFDRLAGRLLDLCSHRMSLDSAQPVGCCDQNHQQRTQGINGRVHPRLRASVK